MADWYVLIQGEQHGPLTDGQLGEWASTGRLRAHDPVWKDGMADWAPAHTVPGLFPEAAASTPPPFGGYPGGPQSQPYPQWEPHRGGAVLALGICGLVVCGICGIIAWVMGNTDMQKIEAGSMDPSGRGITQAGRVCGIIGTFLMVLYLLWMCVWFGLFGAMASRGF